MSLRAGLKPCAAAALLTSAALLACGTLLDIGPDGETAADAGIADSAAPRDGVTPDGGTSPPDAGPDTNQPDVAGRKRVFVTSGVFVGGALGDRNGHCSTAVGAAGLQGKFVAWLADTTTNPYPSIVEAGGPWYLVDRTTLAASLPNFPGTLEHAIDRDENGALIAPDAAGQGVWTGLKANGSLGQYRCGEWTDPGMTGTYGDFRRVDPSWTDVYFAVCSSSSRLYCFEL